MDIGERIKQLRLEHKMTLEQLGDKVGVGKSTVRKWENGMIENMRRDKIDKLANALNCSPGFLMGWDKDMNQQAQLIVKIRNDPELLIALEKYMQLPREKKMHVIKIIDVLSEVHSDD